MIDRMYRYIVVLSVLATLFVAIFVFAFRHAGARRARWDRLYHMYTAVYILNNLSDVAGQLPPSVYTDEYGNPLYSWRLAAIVYYESGLSAPDLESAWNAPSNSRLRVLAPLCYCFNGLEDTSKGVHAPSLRTTDVVAITGPGTAFQPGQTTTWHDLPSDMIILLESQRPTTHWMAPGDMSIADIAVERNTSNGNDDFCVGFADRQVWLLSSTTPWGELQKLMTIAGAQSHDRDALLDAYAIARYPH